MFYSFAVFQHFVIPETQNSEACLLQACAPRCIPFHPRRMLTAIYLSGMTSGTPANAPLYNYGTG